MKGQVHTIEVMVAISLLVFVILILISFPPKQEFSTSNYKLQAFKALKSLDDSNLLRSAVNNNDTDFIESRIRNFISSNLNFKVVIFDKNSNLTVIPKIEGETLIVSYYLAGEIGNYAAREVRLYIWGFS